MPHLFLVNGNIIIYWKKCIIQINKVIINYTLFYKQRFFQPSLSVA